MVRWGAVLPWLTFGCWNCTHENPFKVKSLLAASFRIDKLDRELQQVPFEELESFDGIGKSLASKIQELNTIGTTKELQALLE